MDWEYGIGERKKRNIQGLGGVILRRKNSIKRGSKEIRKLVFDKIDLTENTGN